jgi:drug/metabolite transporter (DMT)-like permease
VFTANVNLLIPVSGVLWGWLLLKERIPAISFLGMTLVVGGLGLVLWPMSAGAAQPTEPDVRREAGYSAR